MSGAPRVEVPATEIASLCQRYHIVRLSLFGSVLRDDFGPESDVDVLVEFEKGKTPGLGFVRLKDELEVLFGRPVDLITRASLRNRFLREEVLSTEHEIYAA